MRCSNDMMKYTGYLHILALMIAIYGTYRQIDAVKGGEPFSLGFIGFGAGENEGRARRRRCRWYG